MKRIELTKGLDLPITGAPEQSIGRTNAITRVALTGDDYIGMRPTMEVDEGDRVRTGQLLFMDKKTEGLRYTSPATGTVVGVNRGAKRKFESVVIEIEEDDHISFIDPAEISSGERSPEQIRSVLQQAGMWSGFRTRPFGKVPAVDSSPAALFITAMDSRPLAADAAVIIGESPALFTAGLAVLRRLLESPLYLCVGDRETLGAEIPTDLEVVEFRGPHPAGLPSTHIHMLDQARESRVHWHIDYQDVIGIGHLFETGTLPTHKIIALAGPAVQEPRLLRVRMGASIDEICAGEMVPTPHRILSGSVLDGRQVDEFHRYLGRYHNQISALHEGSGRSFFSWARLGGDRFSTKPHFTSALDRDQKFAFNTAVWGGKRAIFPQGNYDKVMPLDIIPIALLKAIAVCDTEKSRNLGALELIEDDLALCSFVCPGKNNFAPLLRRVLTEIELEG
ncbi:MAG TPA: Na(+)-translocating NADH-quinone reductase subunit A [Desulfopila sp.]|nr:Na(+)-translocating NADH-quinone reductase subunit A [Desulfopila sp.]